MKKTNNTEAFYALLKAGLWEKNVQLFQYGDIDYYSLYQLAEEQSVVGIVTAGLEHVVDMKLPQEHLLTFIGNALQIEQCNKSMNLFVADLVSRMGAAGIYTLLVKGQGTAQCYERPLWRTSGDVDFFLSDDNYDKAKAFLMPLASSVEGEYVREKHQGMVINECVVELHGRLYGGLSSRIERELDRVYIDTFYGGAVRSWNNNGVQVFMLKAENDVFYVFTHILQHFYKEGVGLRQICDWCRLLWSFKDKLELSFLELRVKKAGLMSEWKAFGAYAVDYLGMPAEVMPFYSSDYKWKRKAKRINDFILNVGNMGHSRDSHYMKYPFLIRKSISSKRRIGDIINHAKIFPLDSIVFSFAIMFNGLMSVVRGEG